jgi:conjugative relaxase-like TrwC/TraI family protein
MYVGSNRCSFGKRATLGAPRVHLRPGGVAVGEGGGVLSVAKLTLGQELYYEQQVARGLDDYYAGRGESPGLWAGSNSARLGLVGVVSDGDLGTLLRGLNPQDKETLRSPVRERTITARRLDLESGEWREESKRLAPVSGYDLVFSCPKSVSLLHALTDDEEVRSEISEAHEASWQAALGYLEREACLVRRGKGGSIREHGSGFVAAAFRHRTSRAQEPHLHTHVIVANLTRAEDGEWRALDGEAILKTCRLAAGYLYEAGLRSELTKRLGLEWSEPAKGMAELARMPQEALRAFSSRRLSLLEHMEALGTEGFAASRVAALATRERKEDVELPRLREEWLAKAEEHGLGRRELYALAHYGPIRRQRVDRERLASLLLGPEGLTEKETSFTLPELVRAVAGALPQGASVAEVEEIANSLVRLPGVEPLAPGAPGRPARYTSRELLALEREALQIAIEGRDAGAPCPDRRTLLPLLLHAPLSQEQRELVREASERPDRVVCAAGVAGSGKTSALRVLADAYRACGIPVLGVAPSGRAADELTAATGIQSRTLHRLLLDVECEGGLPHGSLLLVDESGMAETRVLAPLLRLAEEAEAKVLLVGDPAQLPSVGAGGLYQALCERLGAIELTVNQRQRDLSEREALERLREGEPEPYLARQARRGRLSVEENPLAAKRQLLADWWRYAQHDPERTCMLAYHRQDVSELNEAAHALMLRSGRLEEKAVALGGREFRVGERVLCKKNDVSLRIRNGTRGTIVAIDKEALILREDAGPARRLPFSYAEEHLEHGYALTGHAAQGTTLERTFVLLPDHGSLREWGYVAAGRAREETRLYLAQEAREPGDSHAREIDTRTAPQRVARALERKAAEPLAIEQQRRGRVDPVLNYLTQQRQQLDRDRERTADRLAGARRDLQDLRWWNRDRRAELEREIGLDQKMLERLDAKEEELRERAEQRSKERAFGRERDELTRSLQPESPSRSLRVKLEREPPGLEW